jgi:hypothetical protein
MLPVSYAEYHTYNPIMLSIIMLSVVMLSVDMLSVLALVQTPLLFVTIRKLQRKESAPCSFFTKW